LSGLTLEEIRISIRGRLNDLLNRNWALIQLFIESASDLFDFTSPVEIHTSGTQNIISQPEFSNKNMLEAIFAFVEDKKGLMKMIQSIIQDPSVAIGHENSDSRLKSFSVITSFYKMGDNSGVIGVIGPTRMRYEKIVPLVNQIANTLTEYWS
jgi:heat-inducible transcriptional repressor